MGLYDSLLKQVLNLSEYESADQNHISVPEAIDVVRRQVAREEPDLNDTDKSLSEFWNRLASENPQLKRITPKFRGKPEKVAKRLEYSRKCRDAMFKVLEKHATRTVEFHKIAIDLYGDNSGVNEERWLEHLIKLPSDEPDDKKRRLHNEKVVALVALGQNSPQNKAKEKFLEVRKNAYINDYDYTPEEAEKAANKELEYGVNHLLDLAKDLVKKFVGEANDFRSMAKEMRQIANSILDGSAEHLEGGLDAAYDRLIQPANIMMYDGIGLIRSLKRMGVKGDSKELESLGDTWQNSSRTEDIALAMVQTNPIYSMVEPGELVMADVNGGFPSKEIPLLGTDGKPVLRWKTEKIRDKKGRVMLGKDKKPLLRRTAVPVMIPDDTTQKYIFENNEPIKDISGKVIEISPENVKLCKSNFFADSKIVYELTNESLKNALPQYALRNAKNTEVGYPMFAYSNGTGRSVLLYVENVSVENGLEVRLNDKVPGKAITIDYKKRLRMLNAMSTYQDKWGRSSGRYRTIQNKLASLANIRFDDNPTPEQINELRTKLNEVKNATKDYIAHKDKNSLKSEYRKYRYRFAQTLDEFADRELEILKMIEEHQKTLEQKAQIESNPPEVVDAEIYKDMSAFERTLWNNEKAKSQKIREEYAGREAAKEAEILSAGKSFCAALSEYMDDNKAELEPIYDTRHADAYLEEFIDTNKFETRNAMHDSVRAEHAKKTLAGMALRELIKAEGELNINRPFGTLVKAGKIDDAAELIINGDSFQKYMDEMKATGNDIGLPFKINKHIDANIPSKVAVDILKGIVAVSKEQQNSKKNAEPGKNPVNAVQHDKQPKAINK